MVQESNKIESLQGGVGSNGSTPQLVSPEVNRKTLIIDEDQLLSYLKAYATQKGYIADAAVDLGVSPQFLGACLSGKRRPGRKLLEKLGIEVVYRVEVI